MQDRSLTAVATPRVKDFFIKYTSPIDGSVLEGTFTTKKLSVKGITAVQVRKIQLNGGFFYDEDKPGTGVDEQSDWTNYMIAHLEHSIIRKPTWWNMDEIDDIELLLMVFREVASFENSFRSPLQGAAVSVPSSQTDSGGTNTQSGAAGHVAPMGRGEVPPSLEP